MRIEATHLIELLNFYGKWCEQYGRDSNLARTEFRNILSAVGLTFEPFTAPDSPVAVGQPDPRD